MAALVYEIIWIRPLSLVFGTTIYAVSTIIASFIFGLALGSWLVGKYSDKMNNPLRYFAFIEISIGLYGILLLPIFATLPGVYLDLYHLTYPNQEFFIFFQIILTMGLILIPTTLMGSTLPIILKSYSEKFTSVGKDIGKIYSANNLGAVGGTLAAGFLMIPILGIQNSILFIAIVNVGMGISILVAKRYLNYRFLIPIIIIAILFFLFLPSYDIQALNLGVYAYLDSDYTSEDAKSFVEKEKVLFYKESLYSSVLVTASSGYETLKINGKAQCSTNPPVIEGLERLAIFPYELYEYNYEKPKNALNIGLGCGTTSKWLSERVETITLEIDPIVAESSKLFYDNIDHRLVIDDARNWLFRNDEKFDLITIQPSDPYENHGSLFTKEFFELLNERLSENGLVSQWVPLYVLTLEDFHIFYNTFNSVFPYIYVYQLEKQGTNQLVLVGSTNQLKIQESDFEILKGEDVARTETELNTDDRNLLEFKSAINLYNDELGDITISTIRDNT